MSKLSVFNHIQECLQRLIQHSDLTVFTLYNPDDIKVIEPINYMVANRQQGFDNFPMTLDYDGIGVWYIFNNTDDETFSSIKILAFMKDGVFIKGQVGDFEGFKDEIEDYIDNDSWVGSTIANHILQQQHEQLPT